MKPTTTGWSTDSPPRDLLPSERGMHQSTGYEPPFARVARIHGGRHGSIARCPVVPRRSRDAMRLQARSVLHARRYRQRPRAVTTSRATAPDRAAGTGQNRPPPSLPRGSRRSPNAGLAQRRAQSPICIGNVGATWLRRAGSRAAAFGARAHCRLTPTPVTRAAWLLRRTSSNATARCRPDASGRKHQRGAQPACCCFDAAGRAAHLLKDGHARLSKRLVRSGGRCCFASPSSAHTSLISRPGLTWGPRRQGLLVSSVFSSDRF